MLAFLGILTIVVLLVCIILKKMSPITALILVPIATALAGGFGLEIINFIESGVAKIAPMGIMFIFAILFFGVLTDAGTFAPLIQKMKTLVGNHPERITVGTAILAMLVHFDGSGAVTFLIVIPAMLPMYQALQMRKTTLATVTALAAGTMNMLPWGGPTIRAASALDVSVTAVFNPLVLPFLVGLCSVLVIAFFLGKKEKQYVVHSNANTIAQPTTERNGNKVWKLIFNWLVIMVAISALISAVAPPHVIFIIAFAIALVVNYPKPKQQLERINAHASEVLLMSGILFAAGCFTGILTNSGMIAALVATSVNYIPEFIGNHMAVATGCIAMPASLVFDPDSFYFGILPVLSDISVHYGGNAVEVGRAAITGQMTTGFPVSPLTGSTYLLVGLTGVELGDHQRKTIPWAFLVSILILCTAILTGAITF